jgi:hypothetical protein
MVVEEQGKPPLALDPADVEAVDCGVRWGRVK